MAGQGRNAVALKKSLFIDGSQGEGGGQVLRNSMSYAAILKKAIRIDNIRAGRSKPGLASQHLTGLQLACQICGGGLEGDQLSSQSIQYDPDWARRGGNESLDRCFTGDTKTAGSICLLLQTALPCALFGTTEDTKLILKGGTNATMAPQYDYWVTVFLPTLERFFRIPQWHIQSIVKKRGYYPRGGGEVCLTIKPWTASLNPIQLTERGEVTEIYIRSFVAGNVPAYVAGVMTKAAKSFLQPLYPEIIPQVDEIIDKNCIGSGSGILIIAKTSTSCLLAGSALGSFKTNAKEIGKEAANELAKNLSDGGCVDEWLQDQLIIYMALASGSSEILTGSLTLHTQTAIEVAKQVCGAKFEVTRLGATKQEEIVIRGEQGGTIPGKHLIRCIGINHSTYQPGNDGT